MRAQLCYRPREGIVSGVVAGKLFRLPTQRDQARITAWEKQQELRSGKVTRWDHVFESPHRDIERARSLAGTSPAGPVGPNLTVVESAALEIYDWPGRDIRHGACMRRRRWPRSTSVCRCTPYGTASLPICSSRMLMSA
jgi:hypothetical protein